MSNQQNPRRSRRIQQLNPESQAPQPSSKNPESNTKPKLAFSFTTDILTVKQQKVLQKQLWNEIIRKNSYVWMLTHLRGLFGPNSKTFYEIKYTSPKSKSKHKFMPFEKTLKMIGYEQTRKSSLKISKSHLDLILVSEVIRILKLKMGEMQKTFKRRRNKKERKIQEKQKIIEKKSLQQENQKLQKKQADKKEVKISTQIVEQVENQKKVPELENIENPANTQTKSQEQKQLKMQKQPEGKIDKKPLSVEKVEKPNNEKELENVEQNKKQQEAQPVEENVEKQSKWINAIQSFMKIQQVTSINVFPLSENTKEKVYQQARVFLQLCIGEIENEYGNRLIKVIKTLDSCWKCGEQGHKKNHCKHKDDEQYFIKNKEIIEKRIKDLKIQAEERKKKQKHESYLRRVKPKRIKKKIMKKQ